MPKKRGPKTDVLEALLKRVDGLEAKLKEKKDQPGSPTIETGSAASTAPPVPITQTTSPESSSSAKPSHGDTIEVKPKPKPAQPVIDTNRVVDMTESVLHTPSPSRLATFMRDYNGEPQVKRKADQPFLVLHHHLAFSPIRCWIPTSRGSTQNHSTSSTSLRLGNDFSSRNCQVSWCMLSMPLQRGGLRPLICFRPILTANADTHLIRTGTRQQFA